MATLLPFLRIPDIAFAKAWYESIGFNCIGTHEEPGCGLDWAMMAWDDAMFMLYSSSENTFVNANNSGLYSVSAESPASGTLAANKHSVCNDD